jgi:hypothetical protein
MNHAAAMGVVERARHLGGQPHRVADGELFLAREPVAERLSVDVRHDVVGRAVGLAGIDEPEDVRVLQGGDGLDLTEEPLGADHGGQLGLQDLDGDVAVMLEVFGQIDRGHPTLPELPLDAVAVGKRRREGVEPQHAHGRSQSGAGCICLSFRG